MPSLAQPAHKRVDVHPVLFTEPLLGQPTSIIQFKQSLTLFSSRNPATTTILFGYTPTNFNLFEFHPNSLPDPIFQNQWVELRTLTKETIFNRIIPEVCTIKKDLEKAGVPFIDRLGRRFDFHALRYCYAHILVENNVPERVRMELMRHSNLSMTSMTYTTADELPTKQYVEQLEPAKWTEKWTEGCVLEGQKRSISGINDEKRPELAKNTNSQVVDNQKIVKFSEEEMVPRKGLEPLRLTALDPKSSVSANFTTWARGKE